MKKLILLSLLLPTIAMAYPAAPKKICLFNNTNTDEYTGGVQLQLSWPGQDGLWSPYIARGQTQCLYPYAWKGNHDFGVYSELHNSLFPNYLGCSGIMSTSAGINKAAPGELDYQLVATSARGNFKCKKLT